jgi:Tfp pilus assembly protein PilF
MTATLVQAEESLYGPFDYTNPEHFRDKLPIVERAHFNSDVENLRRGQTSAFVASDIAYVLRSFPNHHRALNAMSRLWRQHRNTNTIPPGIPANKTPEFYFEKAINFSPDDGYVRLLYAIHLHTVGKYQQALEQYKEAERLIPNSPELHYNVGLLYVSMGKIAQAKEHATQAYNHNYPLQGLKKKLIDAGAWETSQ